MKTKQKALPTEFTKDEVSDGDRISFERDGFTVVATIEYDNDADTSHLGEFSDEPEEGAVDHHATGTWLQRSTRGQRYFNPPDYAGSLASAREYQHLSEEAAKAEADRRALEDYKRLVDYYQGAWNMVGVVVTVSREGVKLGEASMWGIESDSGTYFNEAVGDLLHDALPEAKRKLKALADFAKECSE
jgi:hypothetical protein